MKSIHIGDLVGLAIDKELKLFGFPSLAKYITGVDVTSSKRTQVETILLKAQCRDYLFEKIPFLRNKIGSIKTHFLSDKPQEIEKGLNSMISFYGEYHDLEKPSKKMKKEWEALRKLNHKEHMENKTLMADLLKKK